MSKRNRKRITLSSVAAAIVCAAVLIFADPDIPLFDRANEKESSYTEVLDTYVLDTYVLNGSSIEAEVTSVTDGDTFKIKGKDGKTEKVRLLLIDTPEIGDHPEPFALEARDYTADLLKGQTVRLEFDVSERDQYGRLLAYAYIGDHMVNELLLEEGLARVAVFPPDIKFEKEFKNIADKARKAKRGVWSIDNYVTNRGFDERAVNK
ncbi:hypothetical protein C2I18_25775 [Paenibacillus sp. PK3_47]|uniref:thermonuclease family protein n=1 Tax=Paenibacillus sp. PK3_47 TaxID=2072642 RepID=UPI00201D3CD9|nr:thermonuclease family protein [Paenibacillus sp. PK3_47]UQZ36644.1 hypothetical protein C2I18_25775 [Paenibacillus sp. PK3_47]